MAETRTPGLRPATPAEEMAKLHPLERALLRVFEFCSSIKLALCLMAWLIVECSVGTFVESQVSTAGAKYFVYDSPRFVLLLSLLGLNILCAALIRFPWKRYQTGFVVTHCGLLTLLVGSMLTWRGNLDSLMPVPQGEAEADIVNPDREQIIVRTKEEDGKVRTDKINVDFGPYTWGHKLFE
ncbi:MAG: hypothetical protein ACRC1K_15385, partial [Planctomycetia bacterium]